MSVRESTEFLARPEAFDSTRSRVQVDAWGHPARSASHEREPGEFSGVSGLMPHCGRA
jgi:hypothetical protein